MATTANLPQSSSGRQYHIGCGPGDVHPNILLVGDPARAHRIGKYFTTASAPICHREYVTISGHYRDLPISVMATGMGPDNTEIAIVEIMQLVATPTFVRVGTSGALQDHINIGDLVISSGAIRMENTSTAYVPEGYPAMAHPQVLLALLESASQRGAKFHVGLTATGSGFYGAQGRHVPGFPPRRPEILDELARVGACNFEMEASCLFTLANLAGARAGCVCGAIAQRRANQFVDDATKDALEKLSIEVGLDALTLIARMDAKRGNAAHWLPSMGM